MLKTHGNSAFIFLQLSIFLFIFKTTIKLKKRQVHSKTITTDSCYNLLARKDQDPMPGIF